MPRKIDLIHAAFRQAPTAEKATATAENPTAIHVPQRHPPRDPTVGSMIECRPGNDIVLGANQIKDNTGYILHPDEILADNFSFIMQDRDGLNVSGKFSPAGKQLLKDVEGIIKK